MWQTVAINSALALIGRLVEAGVVSAIRMSAARLESLGRQFGETDSAYNARRRQMVIDEIKCLWPKTRTALVDAVLALVVMQLKK